MSSKVIPLVVNVEEGSEVVLDINNNTIPYELNIYLEDAVEGERGNVNCDDEEDTFMKDIDSIFETLEGVVDAFYSQEKVKKLPCNDLKIIPPNPYVKDSPSLPERY